MEGLREGRRELGRIGTVDEDVDVDDLDNFPPSSPHSVFLSSPTKIRGLSDTTATTTNETER